ncbi:MAG: EamA family transporter [Candidatus Nanopelagicales bacterium]|jgi:inner membrane transporter RhtA|nr:EamA family transporter [Candidatus Nanopelagicales bacterium]
MTDRVPAWSLAVAAMLTVQIGAALSVSLFDTVGAGGTAWLRLTAGAIIFLLIARPRLRGMAWPDLRAALVLGMATGLITTSFLTAIERIPLGTAVAIEFLGPLGVAVARSRSRALLVWPALALVGVLLLTEPWQGTVDLIGVLLAVISAVGWATYIVLTQHVGDRFEGLQGLSITIPVAAVTAAVIGVPQAAGNITWQVVLTAFGLALLLPVIPFSLEMLALRRLTTSAFGTLMALEPAFGLLMGVIVLSQIPHVGQIAGVALVVVAGIGAERSGHREPQPAVPLLE